MKFIDFDKASPQEILEWACDKYKNICLATSFGKDSTALIHMIRQFRHDIHFVFINTGLAFGETFTFIDKLRQAWRFNVVEVKPSMSVADQVKEFGPELFKTDPAKCCSIRKVEPMARVLPIYDAWITGLRRDESEFRKDILVIKTTGELTKINPLANWTEHEVWNYIHENDIPYHPLYDQGYRSLGCAPCTLAGRLGQFERAGRWSGTALEGGECGLHTETKP